MLGISSLSNESKFHGSSPWSNFKYTHRSLDENPSSRRAEVEEGETDPMESAGDLLLRRFSVAIKFVIISVSQVGRSVGRSDGPWLM